MAAEDRLRRDDRVDHDEHTEDDEHDRQAAAPGELVGEGHHDGGDEHQAQDEQRHGLDGLLVVDASLAGAELAHGESDEGDGCDDEREHVEAVATEEPVEEPAGDLLVLGREGRERDVVEHLERHAAEQEHAGQGDDERRDPDVGDPEALPRTDHEADREGGEDADPPGLPVLDDDDRRGRTGQRDDRADRQVDVPADDDDDHADREDQDVRVLQDDVREVARAEQHPVREHREETDDGDERDVDPARAEILGEDLLESCDGGHRTGSFSCVMSSMRLSWVAPARST